MSKLDTVLKEKYAGKKYMEVPTIARRDDELRAAMDEDLAAIAKRYGATGVYLSLHTDESRFNGFHQIGQGESLYIFQDVLERLKKAVDKSAIKSLAAAMDDDEGGDVSSFKAIKDLLEELPPEVHDEVIKTMGKMSGQKIPPGILKKDSKDETDLLDDLLG